MAKLRIVHVDGHRSFLDCFAGALALENRYALVGQATHACEAIALCEAIKPDLLVTELLLQDSDAVALARELVLRNISTRLVILSAYSHTAFVIEAMQAGAFGYALKSQRITKLFQAIDDVAAGRKYLAPELASGAALHGLLAELNAAPSAMPVMRASPSGNFSAVAHG